MPHRKCAVTMGKQHANPSLIAVNTEEVLGNAAINVTGQEAKDAAAE